MGSIPIHSRWPAPVGHHDVPADGRYPTTVRMKPRPAAQPIPSESVDCRRTAARIRGPGPGLRAPVAVRSGGGLGRVLHRLDPRERLGHQRWQSQRRTRPFASCGAGHERQAGKRTRPRMIRRHGRGGVRGRAEYRTMGRAGLAGRTRNNRALRSRHGVDVRRGRRFLARRSDQSSRRGTRPADGTGARAWTKAIGNPLSDRRLARRARVPPA